MPGVQGAGPRWLLRGAGCCRFRVPMRWPRKAILIRIAIYGPLILFFGGRAIYTRCVAEREASDATPAPIEGQKRTVTLPDGSSHEIIELSPEQAEKMLGRPLPDPPDDAKEKPSE